MAEKKTAVKKTVKPTKTKEEGRYWQAVGRRKTATAQVRIWEDAKGFLVNGQKLNDYFKIKALIKKVSSPLEELKLLSKFRVTVIVKGGGPSGQAEAVRHGLARAIIKYNADFQKSMRELGFLTRDSRRKERKKPGLKRARKAPQFSKR